MIINILHFQRLLLDNFFFQAEDGIRDATVTGVQTCALPISGGKLLNHLRDSVRSSWAMLKTRQSKSRLLVNEVIDQATNRNQDHGKKQNVQNFVLDRKSVV